eukprot:426807_1
MPGSQCSITFNWVVVYTLLSLLTPLIIFLSSRANSNASKCMKSLFLMSLFFILYYNITWAILSLTDLAEIECNNLYKFHAIEGDSILYTVMAYSGLSGWSIANISLNIFLKITIQNIYKHRYFSLNICQINIALFIYTISTLIWTVSYMQSSPTVYIYGYIQWMIVVISYYSFMVILVNKKLAQFLSLAPNKNNNLQSRTTNAVFSNLIIKQTNLFSFIAVINSIMNAADVIGELCSTTSYSTFVSYIDQWICFTHCVIFYICLYLLYTSNYTRYLHLCKLCHHCCAVIRQGISKDDNVSYSNAMPLLSINTDTGKSLKSSSSIFTSVSKRDNLLNITACNLKCKIKQNVLQLLKKYQKYGLEILKHNGNVCANTISNYFHHMLTCHTSENEFSEIYDTIMSKQCECNNFIRHQRRRDLDPIAQQSDSRHVSFVMLDKIHTFYCHPEIRNSKPRLSNTNFNKFNSNLQLNENFENIYSFGQRFEYEDEKNDWYCPAKYKSFKEELIYNNICNITNIIYKEECNKCDVYMESIKVKQMQQICKHKQIIFGHILTLLIYCNCDQYQTNWSASYRKLSTETDKSFKHRHSHFYFSSKYVQVLVEWFGTRLVAQTDSNPIFFHGVSQILYFYKTIAQFNCPLSTSTDMVVAQRFSSQVGIILVLKYSGFSLYPLNARYFECKSFSDYPEENEDLFVGGNPMMAITNIINQSNGEIYEPYINALNVINAILNGTYSETSDVNIVAINLCASLLNQQKNEMQFPEYVTNLLYKYRTNLSHIIVFWNCVQNMKKLH